MATKKDQSKDVKNANTEAYQKAMAQIEKDFGKGAVMTLGAKGALDIPVIPTGALSLDNALGIGGIPRGRITEIYGPESSGKTTLCGHVIASAQALGGRCAVIDTEHALDPVYFAKLGVEVDSLAVSQPDCGEDALNIAQIMVDSGAFAVIVIDSVAALVPRAEIEGQMGDSHVGLHARLMSQALRKLTAAVSRSGTALLFTNQLREKIGIMFGNPETTTGGNALKFYASVRLDIRRKEKIEAVVPGRKDKEYIGNSTKVKIVKNKCAPPFKSAVFDIRFGTGIDKVGCILDMAIDLGLVEKRGSWFSYGSDQIGQGRDQARDTMASDVKLTKSIETVVMKRLAEIKSGAVTAKAENVAEEGVSDGEAGEAEGMPGESGL